MGYQLNVFTGNLDITGGGVPVYANFASFPASGSVGDLGVAADTGNIYEWNGSSWQQVGGPGTALALGNLDSQSETAQGAALVGGALSMQSADATHPGLVNNTTQSFSGNKIFTGTIGASNLSGINTGDQIITLTSDVSGSGTGSFAATVNSVGGSSAANVHTAEQTVNTSQSGNKVLASPSNGSSGTPSFRTLVSNDIPNLSAVYVTQSEVGSSNGVASLDGGGKVPLSQLPATLMEFQGNWNPNTNTPALVDGTGVTGYTYWVSAVRSSSVSGLTDPSMVNFQIGDLVIYNGTQWVLVTPAAGVQSVNGAQGAVIVNAINQLTGDVTTSAASGSQSKATTVAQIQGTTVSGTTGSGNVVFSSAPTLSNPVVGTQVTTDNSTKAASTAYVTTAINNAISGVNPAVAVQAATTSSSDTSGFTYNNGVSGIGATLTGSINTAIIIDGYTFTTLGQRLLVKNDTQSPSGAFNGVYYVTQVQTSLLPPILTRALDYDMPSDINNTGAIPVVNGTVNSTTSWVQTAIISTVGTDPLVFVKFSRNPSDYLLASAGDINETSFSLANNQSAATNITGLAFANSTVRAAEVLYSVYINATSSLYETGKLLLVQRGSDWAMSQMTEGDDSLVRFSVTTAGQLQYTDSNYTGFSSGTIKFRCLTTSV